MNGLHLLADLRDCAATPLLNDAALLRACCLEAVAASGLEAVGQVFHPFVGPDGQAQGVTGVVLLAESHVAVHTWPESGAVTADVYVCNVGADNSARAEGLLQALVAAFAPGAQFVRRVVRGVSEGR